MDSEPTCWALCCRGAGCLRGVGTYVLGTVLQGCRLFKGSRNLRVGHCVAGVQLSGVGTYLVDTACVAGMQAV